jgi:hypothetical protein
MQKNFVHPNLIIENSPYQIDSILAESNRIASEKSVYVTEKKSYQLTTLQSDEIIQIANEGPSISVPRRNNSA